MMYMPTGAFFEAAPLAVDAIDSGAATELVKQWGELTQKLSA